MFARAAVHLSFKVKVCCFVPRQALSCSRWVTARRMPVTTIYEWLRSIGMSEYAERFAKNDIDIFVLRHLTDRDLRELGVSLGHRRKMLAAISELASAVSAPQGIAERRQLTVMFCDLVGSIRRICVRSFKLTRTRVLDRSTVMTALSPNSWGTAY